jgi:hypothetical protein
LSGLAARVNSCPDTCVELDTRHLSVGGMRKLF